MYLSIILQILLGFIIADIGSGIIHWFEDTYFDYCNDLPIIGSISKENELHHYFPRSIIVYSYIELMTFTVPVIMFVLLLLFILYRDIFNYKYFIISLTFFSLIPNIIHSLAHRRECENNICIRILQNMGILCSHKHHSIHHAVVDKNYCVISNYSNYVLDNIYFFRGLENMIYLFTGVKANRKPSYESYKEIQNYMHENAKLICPDKPNRRDVEILVQNLKNYKKCNST